LADWGSGIDLPSSKMNRTLDLLLSVLRFLPATGRITCIAKFGCCLTTALLALVLAAPVSAAEPTPTELAVGRRLFREATELEAAQHWEQAAAKLREAIRIKDTPGLRYHLAHCEENLGRLVEAMLDYDRARDLIAAGMRADDVEALLPEAQRALARRVPSIVIVSPQEVKDISASIDGQSVAASVLGRPAPVNPGTHRVTVSAPGYQDFVGDVSVTEGERRVLRVELVPEGTLSSSAYAPAPRHARPLRQANPGLSTRTYVLVGEVAVTAASLAVGVTFMIAGSRADDRVSRASDRVDRVASESGQSPRCDTATGDVLESCRDLADAINDRNRYQWLSTAGFVGSGVGALSTLATYLLWRVSPSPVTISGHAETGAFWLGARTRF
jgi:hypothetical protein